MHKNAYDYIAEQADGRQFTYVVEVGSRDINGTVRPLFDCDTYIGVDLIDGPGVDVVADATEWEPALPADVVVCCEVLEHAPNWEDLVTAMAGWLEPHGTLMVTAATDGRSPHSALDGAALKDGEYYGNVDPDDLCRVVSAAGLQVVDCRVNDNTHDVYMTAVVDF